MYEQKIAQLTSAHAALKLQLAEAEAGHATDEEIHEIKKKKLLIKDQIRDLTKLDNEGQEFK